MLQGDTLINFMFIAMVMDMKMSDSDTLTVSVAAKVNATLTGFCVQEPTQGRRG